MRKHRVGAVVIGPVLLALALWAVFRTPAVTQPVARSTTASTPSS